MIAEFVDLRRLVQLEVHLALAAIATDHVVLISAKRVVLLMVTALPFAIRFSPLIIVVVLHLMVAKLLFGTVVALVMVVVVRLLTGCLPVVVSLMILIIFASVVSILLIIAAFLIVWIPEREQPLLEVLHEGLILREPMLYLIQFYRVGFELLVKDWFDVLVVLFHDVLVIELLLDLLDALYIRVNNLALLGTVAQGDVIAPVYLVEFQVEVKDVHGVQHVDEGEADRTLRLEVHGKVKVVVLAHEVLVYQFQHVSLQELDWYVSYH